MKDAIGQGVLNEAELKEFASLLNRKYASMIHERHFEVVMAKDARGVYATVTLRNPSGSYFYPVEGRVAHDDHEMSVRDACSFLLDYIDSYFEEYFRGGGEVYLPIDWSDYEHEGVVLQLKGQILNLEVERMADEILSRSDLH